MDQDAPDRQLVHSQAPDVRLIGYVRPRGQLLPARRAVGELPELAASDLMALVRVPRVEHLA
eukprot:870621-Alexandrium_andersonii.AAC.1